MTELVIVMAIIAVIMSTVFLSIILIFSANAKSTANDIQRAIGDCKVTTMGRSEAYMELYRDSSNNHVYTKMYIWDAGAGAFVELEPQKVGPKKVNVKYVLDGTEFELLAGRKVEIWFDRATGGFKEDSGGKFCNKIIVEGGSKKYEITLTRLTGKSEVKSVAVP